MADIMKAFIKHMNGAHKAAVSDAAAMAMAEHCDKRIKTALKAIGREEKYLQKVRAARNTGGIMKGDIEGAFHRIRAAITPEGSEKP